MESNIKSVEDEVDGAIKEYDLVVYDSKSKSKVKFNTSKEGSYKIDVIAKDKSSNTAKESFNVEIKDTKKVSKVNSIKNLKISNYTKNKESKGKKHSINRNAIIGDDLSIYNLGIDCEKEIKGVLNDIKNNKNKFYYDYRNFVVAISSIEQFYDCDGKINFQYYYNANENYGSFSEENFNDIRNCIFSEDSRIEGYKNWIVNRLSTSVDLYANDYDVVNQINNTIKDFATYSITNKPLYTFTETGVGQCYHYAYLFRDMCNAVGIEAYINKNENHAWNTVVIDGKSYKFDVTFNDTSGTNSYSWN